LEILDEYEVSGAQIPLKPWIERTAERITKMGEETIR